MTTVHSDEVASAQKEKDIEMQSHSDDSDSDSETTDTSAIKTPAPDVSASTASKSKSKTKEKSRDVKKTPRAGKIVKKTATKKAVKKKEAHVPVRKIAKLPDKKNKVQTKNRSLLKNAGGIKKPHRFRPGTVALREIRKYQKTTENLVPKTAVLRLVREIISEVDHEGKGYHLTKGVKQLLHDLFEDEGVKQFQITQLAALHADRVTIEPKDMQHANNIRNTHPGRMPLSEGNTSPDARNGRLANRLKKKQLKKQKIKDLAVALDVQL